LGLTLDMPGIVRPAEPVLTPALPTAAKLPRWPVTTAFALYGLWWFLGLLDFVLVPSAAVMVLYLLQARGVRVPRGWGVWAFFVLWAGASAMMLEGLGDYIGFAYRYSLLLACSVLFVYVYNARDRLTDRYVLGLLTGVWVTVVVGGYAAVLAPDFVWRTPLASLLDLVRAIAPGSAAILNNDLVMQMVVRPLSQYNPDSTFDIAPRPAAPFLFTNNWGNAYSILLPLVVAYALRADLWRRVLVFVLLPLSAVPALLTLNRGMILGVVLALVYLAVRALIRGRYKLFLSTLAAVALGAALFFALPIQERLDTRLNEASSSTETRASVYKESIAAVPGSPVFGYGTTLEGNNPNAPPIGTQGQVWIILVSHGPVALAAALGWLLLVIVGSRKRTDAVGLAAHVAVVVGTMELFYYGAVPYGLPLLLIAAALAVRRPTRELESHASG
jgi:hypothetical protein